MKLRGCYLCFDVCVLCFDVCVLPSRLVPSGFVCGIKTHMLTRLNDHFKNSCVSTITNYTDSNFYNTYLRLDTPQFKEMGFSRKGRFEDLSQVVGIRFGSDDARVVETLCTNSEEGGILEWTNNAMNSVHRGGGTQEEKKIALGSYLFELAFESCLSKDDNVSESPGFEPYIMHAGGGGAGGVGAT